MNVLSAEWIKLRTVRSTWWALAGAGVLMIIGVAANAAETAGELAAGSRTDSAAVTEAVIGAWFNFVQWALLVPAILAITAEYATRSISTTLQCVPRRVVLLLGKAGVIVGFGMVAGCLVSAAGAVTGWLVLGDQVWLAVGPVVWSMVKTGIYGGLIGVLALALGTLTRSTATTAVVIFLLILIIPELIGVIANMLDSRLLAELPPYFPGPAGAVFLTGEGDAFGPGVGLLVVVGWSVGALAAATALLTVRDA
jgi:ABC-2 type transport system permease protein